jgi:hypothetical protein
VIRRPGDRRRHGRWPSPRRRLEPSPYISGFGDAGVADIVSIVSPRGGEHHQVLDSYEGVAASDSTIAAQLGQITGEIAQHKD